MSRLPASSSPRDVARFQVSSPYFAAFCAEPSTQAGTAFAYLFAESAPRRAEYVTALRELGPSSVADGPAATGAADGDPTTRCRRLAAKLRSQPCDGPHAMHPLRGDGLAQFDALIKRVEAGEAGASDAVVQFALRRPTKTEGILKHLVDVLEREASAWGCVSGLYIAAKLFQEHEAAAGDQRLPPYVCVFVHYLPVVVAVVAEKLLSTKLSKDGDDVADATATKAVAAAMVYARGTVTAFTRSQLLRAAGLHSADLDTLMGLLDESNHT